MRNAILFLLLLGAGCSSSTTTSPAPAPVAPTGQVNIAIINQSTVVSDADVAQTVADVQTQFARDVVPAWGTPTTITFTL